MAGTFFVGEKKVRPGAYYNIKNGGSGGTATAVDGITGLLIKSDWGPVNTAVEVAATDDYTEIFGSGGTTDAIGLAFEGGSRTCIVCRVGSGGKQASTKLELQETGDAATITAKYPGDRVLSVTVKDSLQEGLRECIIYSGTKELEKVSFAKGGDEVSALVEAFAASKNFAVSKEAEASGALAAVAQKSMSGGENPTTNTQAYSAGFQALEPYYTNTVGVDTDDTAVHGLLSAYLDRIEETGQFTIGVVAEKASVDLATRMQHAASFNSEKMVYVLNPKADSAAYGTIEGYQTAAKIAGMVAAVASSTSLTHTVVNGVTGIAEALRASDIIKAEQMGCLVLSLNSSKQVWIDSAINTLVTPPDNKDAGWKKIRRTKTRFELMTRMNNQADTLVGKVDNDTNGRKTILSQLQNIGDAMIVEQKLNRCTVTESSTSPADGDDCYFDIDVVDKDSAEHIYLTYVFRFSTTE